MMAMSANLGRLALLLGLLSVLSGLGLAGETVAQCYDFTAVSDSLKKIVEEVPLDGACLLVVRNGDSIYEHCLGSMVFSRDFSGGNG